ncbi:MAG: hypothetical protein L0323_10860 [Planctomycetes bacterium]|nr:hypothetical protein [Planctomycetota bacterium]
MDARRRLRTVATALSALLLPRLTLATVWTVSPPGGGGQFNDIQSAVNAASPGDTVLVVAGTYPPFVLDKALRVLGVGPGLVTVSMAAISSPPPAPAAVQVTGIPAGSFALIAGMKVQISTVYPPAFCLSCPCSGWPSASALSVANCIGPLFLSNLQLEPGYYFHGLSATASTLVLLDHVAVSGSQVSGCSLFCDNYNAACARAGISASGTNLSVNDSSIQGVTSSTALQIDGASQSILARTNLTGSDAISIACPSFGSPVPKWRGLDAGHGLSVASGAVVRVAGGSPVAIAGGEGGDGYGFVPLMGCCEGGDGGHAVTSSASTVLLAPGLALIPGLPGYSPSCPVLPGQAISGSGVSTASAPLPSLGLNPPLSSPGGSFSLEVKGAASSVFALGVSGAPGFLPIPGVGGALLLDPGSLVLFASGTLDATGTASISAAVAPDPLFSTLVLFLQPATLVPGAGAVDLGPAVPIVIL